MKVVFLTCGPRGAGKTTYCHMIKAQYSEVEIISRDTYLTSLYGTTILPEATSADRMHKINLLMIDRLKEIIKTSDKVILDYWNNSSAGRKTTIKTLRDIGFDKVLCWYFTTPLKVCDVWVQKKVDTDYTYAKQYQSSYELFHRGAENISEDGFDEIVSIDPSCLSVHDVILF